MSPTPLKPTHPSRPTIGSLRLGGFIILALMIGAAGWGLGAR